jgi:hypothetical protein
MTDTSNTGTETAETGEAAPKETDWQAEAKKWEARSKQNFEKAKANEGAAQRLAELEESQKSEFQKLQERAEAAEKRVQAFESAQRVSGWKSEVAEKSGVPASALRGSTLEELQAHAEELKPLIDQSQRRAAQVPGAGDMPEAPLSDNAAWAHALFTQQ